MRQLPFRLLRAAVFAAVTVAASALLHVWGGGGAPDPRFFGAALALAFTAAFAAAGRQCGFLVLAPLCLASQWGLHELFSAGAAAAHEHHAGTAMWLVHGAAALAQAAWMARGEAALAGLLDLLTLWCARALRWCAARGFSPTPPWAAVPGAPRPSLRLAPVTGAVSRRGPPTFTL